MWWLVMGAGAVAAFLPGMLNPMGAVNGLSLLGVIAVVWAAAKLTKGEVWK